MDRVGQMETSHAVDLAIGLGNIISAMWGYYCTAVIGFLAGIAALSASQIELSKNIKVVISVVWSGFTIVNANSILQATKQLNSLLDYIASNTDEISDTVASMKLSSASLVLHGASWVALMLLLWGIGPTARPKA